MARESEAIGGVFAEMRRAVDFIDLYRCSLGLAFS